MKKILGLDLGTNSIGWALIAKDSESGQGMINGIGSRIIPMDAGEMGRFAEGGSISKTAERTAYRRNRRLNERSKLRRERLHRVLNILKILPLHYAESIDFERRLGKFKHDAEPKIAWAKKPDTGFSFLFETSFNEMVDDFRANGFTDRLSHDWTLFYLRKKALAQKIEGAELAWIILHFNQKRGYYQMRGEETEDSRTVNEYVARLKVVNVEKGEVDKKNNKKTWYAITLENNWVYSASFTSEPLWEGHEKDFLITEELNENGDIKIVKDKRTDTEGKEKRKITPLPSFDEINAMQKKDQDKIYGKIKTRTEVTIKDTAKTVGTYIYDELLRNPTQKIKGQLIRTIDRKFYYSELKAILEKQIALQPDVFSEEALHSCAQELYPNNDSHRLKLVKKDFCHLLLDDILFYQRPLKSQKSTIAECAFEFKEFAKLDDNGTPIKVKSYLKGIAKSHPLYQEFRVWQWMHNLRIYYRNEETDVTSHFLSSTKDRELLFEFLMSKKEVNHTNVLEYLVSPAINEAYPDAKPKVLAGLIKKEIAKYRWNYVFDDANEKEDDKSKMYPMNPTGYELRTRLLKTKGLDPSLITSDLLYQLWHLVYSVTDAKEYEKALETFARKHGFYYVPKNERNEKTPDPGCFVNQLRKLVWRDTGYGTLSEKAIRKLTSLLRIGAYWKWEDIDQQTQERIDKILTGEFDDGISVRTREKVKHLEKKEDFQGLPLHLASYLVYDRHSEADHAGKWESINDLERYLRTFKQHSLRNPVVESVVNETLRVVRDIWADYGNGEKNFFDEIHIELGRDIKSTADQRKKISRSIAEKEATNSRIRALIAELKNDPFFENVRPYSPVQQEALKIYENGVLNSDAEIPDDIKKISTAANPSSSELVRYKLWLEQKYKSPYTGQPIPLSKLFTADYQIEHVIPQSRFFDDSLSNKVICESAVNELKGNQLGLEFIKDKGQQIVEIGLGKQPVKILSENAYRDFVMEHYAKNRSKRTKLLLVDVPEKMIERQLNDTRYISRFVTQLLSNIVRSERGDDGVVSVNVVSGNGTITSKLRQEWGLNDVWNEIILPRFERLNTLTDSTLFTTNNSGNKKIPTVPTDMLKGFQKKRIDHRHHALDALVIACATRKHVNYLNNVSAKTEDSHDTEKKKKQLEYRNQLKHDLCYKTKSDEKGNYQWLFKKPWDNFTVDAKNVLEATVTSFKQNLRVINKATNRYEKIKDGKREKVKQTGTNWAIRKPLHKETVSGLVNLPNEKIPKGKIATATRKPLDPSFDLNKIKSITDSGIREILKNYLLKKQSPEVAFSPEGILELNSNIAVYNNGKPHKPILKVRVFEIGSRFPVGEKGNKPAKFVETAKGTNIFFAIYQDEFGKRYFDTIPFNEVVERQKQGVSSVPEVNEKGIPLLFSLSPSDLVYVPTPDKQVTDPTQLTKQQAGRIYRMVSSTDRECHFLPVNLASMIVPYNAKTRIGEMGSLNKSELTIEADARIKESCIKIYVNRLGNISLKK